MAKKKKKVSIPKILIICVVCLIVGFAGGAVWQIYKTMPASYLIPATVKSQSQTTLVGELNPSQILSDELSIHFLELGNKYTGDCSLIKVGNTEVLIDAGSKASSIPTIKNYINQYCTDGKLEYVVVTHAHEDHYAGFATSESVESIFDIYECKTIIEFAKTNKDETKKMHANYIRERNDEVSNGAVCYTALDCVEEQNGASKSFDLGNNVKMEILDSYFYRNEAETENDYSVCLQINQNNEKFYLFTGDLEEDGESYLVDMNPNLGHVELYKAGHHGSKTSSSEKLIKKITPARVCVCCCCGSSEYTSKNENQFPTQAFIDRVAPHTTQVFVTSLCVDYKQNSFTSMNGNIVVRCNAEIVVACSNNTTLLKDTDWFKQNRVCPNAWKEVA